MIQVFLRELFWTIGITFQNERELDYRRWIRFQLFLVLIDQVQSGVDRVVDCEVGEIEKKGAVFVLVDEAEGLIGQSVSEILTVGSVL